MINNFLNVVKALSGRRVIFLLLLSIVLTGITAYLFSEFLYHLMINSVTLSSMSVALVDIIGLTKYQRLLGVIQAFSDVFLLFIFLCYIYLFYRREKNRQYMIHLRKIMNEIEYMAEGNLEYQIQAQHYDDLNQLATAVNNIVLRLKGAIAEERHIEHTKNELITNVSHDLRTPLTSIIGYLDVIEQDQYRDEIELRHYTGIAHKKAESLKHLINELFEYTRMQDNRLILNKAPINIAEILGQLVIQNRIFFQEANIICRENIAKEEMYVLGDGEKLARVFDNLITNATYYGKDGKYVDISASEIDEIIVITITNYGEPIPSTDLPHIFDRFYRAEKSRSKHTGGSGLGLAIAKSIITHHGGSIEAESNVECTSFTVKLEKQNN